MSESKIEWTGRSDWNPVRGCTRASEGCRFCYAEQIAGRFSDPGQAFHGFATRTVAGGRWTGRVELREDRLTLPLRWRNPATIFVNSTSDIFHESLADEAIDRIFAVMALAPQHTFQVLTKRAERMRDYITSLRDNPRYLVLNQHELVWAPYEGGVPKNIWLGVSVEDQAAAEARVPHLLATPASVRFLSCEPLLGPLKLTAIKDKVVHSGFTVSALTGWGGWDYPVRGPQSALPQVHWVIAGGESGRGARPMHPGWLRSLRDECREAQVPFFFKQWGAWAPLRDSLPAEQGNAAWPDGTAGFGNATDRGGKGQALYSGTKSVTGRLLDGVEHNGMPWHV